MSRNPSSSPSSPRAFAPCCGEQVWKFDIDNMTNVVDVYINYLRRKVELGYDRALIRTIRGVGYQIGETSRPS
jgi:DNA-binding response OmpR family regulator